MARTVGIRFRQAGKIFYYDALDFEIESGGYVVVESTYGLVVGRVVIAPDQVIANESSRIDELKPVLRVATQEDVEKADEMRERALDAVRQAKVKIGAMDLNMSIASGEFDLGGTQFTAYFTTPDRVDFRNLVRDLSRDIGARVQLLQVGDRDRAKLTDGVDICGERLCCSSWMTNFPSVSIRMAKEQDLPLNPQKISGVCGRLYCCLTFEYDDYKELRGTLPKVGSFLSTPSGEAKVTGIDFNREVVKLWLTDSQQIAEVAAIDFKLQHGVTIRPMELVVKIEGQMRPISEARESIPTRLPPPRPGRSQEPRGRGPGRPSSSEPTQRTRPGGGRQRPQPSRPQAQPPPAPVNQTPTEGATGEGDRKRRRRRRGRGRGGQGGGEGGTPQPPATT
jgi:cell fate regulator YaaT (PSP1 superfamily)